MNSKAKGTRGENELCEYLTAEVVNITTTTKPCRLLSLCGFCYYYI